jgi:hypothetical protein
MTDDERADLFSVWVRRVVLRHWLLLAGFAAAAGLALLAYGLVRAPLYTSSWLLNIGRVAELGPIETSNVAAARIEAWLQENPAAAACSWRTSHVPEPEVTVALAISCRAPAEADALADGAGKHLLAHHDQLFKEWLTSTEAYIEFLKEQVAKLDGAAMPASPELSVLRIWLKRDFMAALFESNHKVVGTQTHPSEIVLRQAAGGPTKRLGTLVVVGMVLGVVLGLIVSLVRDIRREAAPR